MDFQFVIKTILLAIALAIDACILSMYNGIKQKENFDCKTIIATSLCFGFFQTFMPLIGYFIGMAIVSLISKFTPFIALFLLVFFGLKMIFSGIKNIDNSEIVVLKLNFIKIIGIAFSTSIDSLSIGLTFASYSTVMVIFSCLLICFMTILLSIFGAILGKKISEKYGYKAEIFGGIILILAGVVIFLITII